MKRYKSSRMIRMEHLNHHKNLYAGQAIEWMMENAFIVAAMEYGNEFGLLYRNTHKFGFVKSINPGDVATYEGLIVRVGRTSLTVRVSVHNEKTGEFNADGYVTFVTVGMDNRPKPHGIVLDEPADEEEMRWREEADSFFAK